MLKEVIRCLVLMLVGGVLYFLIEIMFRGYSYGAMVLLGGFCFMLAGRINEKRRRCTPLVFQMLFASVIITLMEFAAGLILNIILKMNMWDYSNMPGNILGQICPQFALLWFFLSAPAIVLEDVLRWKLFNQEKPHYHIFRKKPHTRM